MQVFECQCELVHAKLKVLTNTLCIRTFIRKVTDDIVLATTFKLGSCSVEFTHWEVYRTKVYKYPVCRKAQLTKHIEGGRGFVPC